MPQAQQLINGTVNQDAGDNNSFLFTSESVGEGHPGEFGAF